MNKKAFIGIGVGIVVILTFAGVVISFTSKKEVVPAVPSPTPTPVYKDAPETIVVELKVNKARTSTTLTVKGLNSEYEGIEYELTYDSDKGPKGALSGSRPISIAGQNSFTREVDLGTCSTGGKCTFDTGVKNVKVFIKLYSPSGEIFVVKKDFPEI